MRRLNFQHGGGPAEQVRAWPRTRLTAHQGRRTRESQGKEYVGRRRGRTRYEALVAAASRKGATAGATPGPVVLDGSPTVSPI